VQGGAHPRGRRPVDCTVGKVVARLVPRYAVGQSVSSSRGVAPLRGDVHYSNDDVFVEQHQHFKCYGHWKLKRC
jgi:hypothetical protein